jgi:Cu2+-exporting ATPase
VVARVARPSADSTLADLIKLVERAGQHKPRIAQWADRVAAGFVGALLLFALATLGFWCWHDPAQAWPAAIAVLVVSCPCALSLATPSALAATTDRLLRHGVLVVGPQVLETLQRATHIIFDKTGTLTVGRPVVQGVEPLAGLVSGACLQLAAALESDSAHPLARAIVAAAGAAAAASASASAADPAPATRTRAEAVVEWPGRGIEGMIDGRRYRIGNAAFAGELCGADVAAPAPAGMTTLYLANEDVLLARLLLQDALRDDARPTIDYFRAAEKTVIVLSGDEDALTRRVATALGIGEARGGCLPADKLAYVQQLQRGGAIVAMVGDGINDAAVLSAADVSFAMASGAALAQAHADAVLLSPQLWPVAETARAAGRAMAVIHQNLAWAMLYNVVAIPAAAMGWLNPWLSGAGMALSSAVVVANALRLRRG